MKRLNISIGIICLVILLVFLMFRQKRIDLEIVETGNNELVTYQAADWPIAFQYPSGWGKITISDGNDVCPEEDTYRTPDTVNIFDTEFSFPTVTLPESQSYIQSGVRVYNLNPLQKNICQDEFIEKLYKKEIKGEELSSFILRPITLRNFWGYHNPEASRLNTEGRDQYILFSNSRPTSTIFVIQPYVSFIPYFGSLELKELEEDYKGDMSSYLKTGKTAVPIRTYLNDFNKMVESLIYTK